MKIYTPEKLLIIPGINNQLVWVSGVFDLLHFGHVQFLREAKALGKNLLVVTHSDKYVKLVKGDNRPYHNENERAEILSELISVDYVCIWDGWENITDFALQIKPSIFAITQKSYDHSQNKKWDGSSWEEITAQINAKLVKIDIHKNYSSSNFIR